MMVYPGTTVYPMKIQGESSVFYRKHLDRKLHRKQMRWTWREGRSHVCSGELTLAAFYAQSYAHLSWKSTNLNSEAAVRFSIVSYQDRQWISREAGHAYLKLWAKKFSIGCANFTFGLFLP